MSTQVQYRRGTAAQHATFVGAPGEITVDTTNNTLRVHDGVTPGGHPLTLQTLFNAHLAETVSKVVLVTEPYDQLTKTTVNLGFRPKSVTVVAVILNTKYESIGFADGVLQYSKVHNLDSDTNLTQGVAVALQKNSVGVGNALFGTVSFTDTGLEINWNLVGEITGASGNRRLIISAITHGEG